MYIVYTVKEDSIVTAGLTPWNKETDKAPERTWNASVNFIFPLSADLADTVAFHGDSQHVARLLRSAADMVEHLDECYIRESLTSEDPT